MNYDDIKPPKYFLYETVKLGGSHHVMPHEDIIKRIELKQDFTWLYIFEGRNKKFTEKELDMWNEIRQYVPYTIHKVVSKYELIVMLQHDMVTQKPNGSLYCGDTKLWLSENLPTEGGDNDREKN